MRYAVISDIHGNYPALLAVLADAERNRADKLLLLGDYYADLPFPNEVADTLRNLPDSFVVSGNKEENYLRSLNRDRSTWVHEQMNSLYWNFEQLRPENTEYFINLPEELSIGNIRMFHSAARYFDGTAVLRMGSGRFYHKMKEQPFTHQEYLAYADELLSADEKLTERLASLPDGAYLFGHTHVQWYIRHGGKLLLNPGSCGMPLDFDTRAAYSIIEYANNEWIVEEHRCSYDNAAAAEALRASSLYQTAPDFSNVVIEQLLTAQERVSFLIGEAAKAAGEDNRSQPFPNEVWRAGCAEYRKLIF